MKKGLLTILMALLILPAAAQQYKANFKAAEKFKSTNIRKMLKSTKSTHNGLKTAISSGIPTLLQTVKNST